MRLAFAIALAGLMSACGQAKAPGPDMGAILAETPAGNVTLTLRPIAAPRAELTEGETSARICLHRDPQGATVVGPRGRIRATLSDPAARAEEAMTGGDDVRAPLPGLLREMKVAPGARVAQGDVVAVIEAMKMEHALEAPRDGIVAEIGAAPGDQLAEGAVILALDQLQ